MSSSSQSTANTPWFAVSMVLFGVIGGFVAANVMNATSAQGNPQVAVQQQAPSQPTAPAPAPEAGDVPDVDTDVDHVRGNKDATIALIEYSDFECPFCSRVHDTYVQLLEEDDDVMWVYRHFPLSFHPNAQGAAEGSECIREQGGNDAFWEYADMVFSRGSDNNALRGYVEEMGYDGDAFESCVDSGKYAQKVADQMSGGTASGVNGTPGNIVMNLETGETRLISGAQPITSFRAAIEDLRS